MFLNIIIFFDCLCEIFLKFKHKENYTFIHSSVYSFLLLRLFQK